MFQLTKEKVTYFEVLKRASSFLTKKGASTFVAEWLMRERLNWTKTELVQHYQLTMPVEEIEIFQADIHQFVEGKPMQQIIGHDWFYDRKFTLTADTLIPRPETEEWMDRLLKKLPNRPLKVLDIGTGTGVLAITQKLERPEDQVTAVDISAKALAVAKKNGKDLKAQVNWIESDLFEELKGETFDLILSNPPYISRKEIDLMDESVLHYEPKEALFAENDGLAIYEKIAEKINQHVNKECMIALEIGYAQGEAVSKLFKEELPEAKLEIWQDFSGLDRLVWIKS